MKTASLKLNGGIPRYLLVTISIMAALTVANLHYNVSILDVISHDLGISQVKANLITVLTQGGYSIGLLFIVSLGDLFDAKRIILANFIILILSLCIFAVSEQVELLWIVSVFIGLSSVAVQMYIPVVSAYSNPKHKSRNVGYVVSALLVGVLFGRVAGGLVGDWVGWRLLYVFAAILMALSCLILFLLMPSLKPTFQGNYLSLMRSMLDLVRRYPQVISGSVKSACAFASFQVIWACMSFHVAAPRFNAGSDTVGLLGLCGLVSVVAVMGIGNYVDRYGVHCFVKVGLSLMLMAWLILFGWGNSYVGLIIGIVLVDVGQQFVGVSMQSHILAIDSTAAGRLNTIYMSILFFGATLGTFLAGQGWRFLEWNGVCAIGLVFALLGFVPMKKRF